MVAKPGFRDRLSHTMDFLFASRAREYQRIAVEVDPAMRYFVPGQKIPRGVGARGGRVPGLRDRHLRRGCISH